MVNCDLLLFARRKTLFFPRLYRERHTHPGHCFERRRRGLNWSERRAYMHYIYLYTREERMLVRQFI
jgi:hypothetical protein